MSTTHTISNDPLIPYTVVSGKKKQKTGNVPPELSIVMLNREGRFHREELLNKISALDFAEIIYIEGPHLSFDIEHLSRKFPEVRFLLLKDVVSAGEKINLAFSESRGKHVLIMWSDMHFEANLFSSRLIKKIQEADRLCTVPMLKNMRKQIIPSIQVPGYIKRKLRVMPWKSARENCATIFPFDFCGIYQRNRFRELGGFDPLIKNPYWQKMDFGFRAALWGEKIALNPAFCMLYTLETTTEDSTPDESFKRFYLKNIAVKYHNGRGVLRAYKYWGYLIHSKGGPVQALLEFLQVRKWVRLSQARFKQDFKTTLNLWEPPEEA